MSKVVRLFLRLCRTRTKPIAQLLPVKCAEGSAVVKLQADPCKC